MAPPPRRARLLALLSLSLALSCLSRSASALPAGRARDPFSRDRHVRAELAAVSPGTPGSASVVLHWQPLGNELDAVGVDPARGSATASALGNGEAVVAYEAQYSASGSGEWVTLSDTVTGLGHGHGQATDLHERQLILTRADPGETISDGFFRLALAFAGSSALNAEQRAVTPRIPFDATEAQMKAAVEALDLVEQVQVFRRAAPVGTGAYEWTVVFDRVVTKSAAGEPESGDLPLLALYAETISAPWSGAGDQVAVQSLRERQRDRVVCAAACRLDLPALPTGVTYAFRVRARFSTLGWSEWSAASEPLETPATLAPSAPSSPELVVATALRLKIRWRSPPRSDAARFPVLSFRAQQKCGAELVWTTISDAIAPSLTVYTSLASLPLAPNASCAFRVAAANANGQGPFSEPSPMYSTLATAPAQVEALRPTHESLPVPATQIEWQPPEATGGSEILSYDVQYREADSTTWVQGERVSPSRSGELQRWNFTDRAAWRPYTQYIVRVRAVNGVGDGPFRSTPAFLTPYRAPLDSRSGERKSSVTPSASIPIVSMGGDGAAAGNAIDRYYVHGTGGGGIDLGDGQHGAVLVFPVTLGGERLAERSFFFASAGQRYRVPDCTGTADSLDRGALTSADKTRVVAIDVYAWGAGGGSGRKYASALASDDDMSKGGGGAFVRAQFAVSPGDWVDVIVGGGGASSSSNRGGSGSGGFHGGGDGGRGDFSGGGGGGASEVRINGKTVLVAAGGGGGGATDYCCAHGGAAGGARPAASEIARAQDGQFPDARAIPLDISASADTASSVTLFGPRNEYHSLNVEGDDRDATGLPARHQHLDYGFAGPHADYSMIATGGAGAESARPGSAGQAGSLQYSRAGKSVWSSVDNPVGSVMEIAAPLIASWPTSGQRGRGGHGQDGKDAGGGGGGGYFGGGGGGAGIDGAGGGGGSSFVSINDLFQPHGASRRRILTLDTSGQSVSNLLVAPVSSTSVQLRWRNPVFGFAQQLDGFTIEMANRSMNEDFRFMRFLRASDGHQATNTTITALAPTATYRFRVRPAFPDGSGLFSQAVRVSMPPSPTNEWHRVNGDNDVRSIFGLQEEIRAGIHLADVLPLRRVPSARRGHSLTAFDSYLYLFGGLSKGFACDRAHTIECVQNAGVTNELWRFDPAINTWIESSMFIYGGRNGSNGKVLNDLYRLDYVAETSAAKWTRLAPLVSSTSVAEERRFHSGRSILLTPFELLAVTKGLRSPRQISGITRHFDSGTYVGRKSVAQPRQGWKRLEGISVRDMDDISPAPRYWSSMVYMSWAGRHRIFMFGGQDDTALMDDFWQLDLALLAEQEPPDRVVQSREEICDWRMANAGVFASEWAAACGANSSAVTAGQAKECDLDDLLLFAWCREYHQTLVL